MGDRLIEETAIVRVVCDDRGVATREAANLREHLRELDDVALQADVVKEDRSTQDLGATLVLIFGTPAVVVIARGIADWLRKRRVGSSFEIEINGSRVKAQGGIADDPERLAGLVRALRKASKA